MRVETPRAGPVLNVFLNKIQNQTHQKGKKRKREEDISYFDKEEKGLIINRAEKTLQQKLVKNVSLNQYFTGRGNAFTSVQEICNWDYCVFQTQQTSPLSHQYTK